MYVVPAWHTYEGGRVVVTVLIEVEKTSVVTVVIEVESISMLTEVLYSVTDVV